MVRAALHLVSAEAADSRLLSADFHFTYIWGDCLAWGRAVMLAVVVLAAALHSPLRSDLECYYGDCVPAGVLFNEGVLELVLRPAVHAHFGVITTGFLAWALGV